MKGVIFGVGLITLAALISLVYVVLRIDPFELQAQLKILFFIFLFLGLTGVLTFFILALKRLLNKRVPLATIFYVSFLQGLLLAIATVALLLGGIAFFSR